MTDGLKHFSILHLSQRNGFSFSHMLSSLPCSGGKLKGIPSLKEFNGLSRRFQNSLTCPQWEHHIHSLGLGLRLRQVSYAMPFHSLSGTLNKAEEEHSQGQCWVYKLLFRTSAKFPWLLRWKQRELTEDTRWFTIPFPLGFNSAAWKSKFEGQQKVIPTTSTTVVKCLQEYVLFRNKLNQHKVNKGFNFAHKETLCII